MRMPRRFVSLITGMTIAIAAAWAGSPALAASVDPVLRPYSTKPAPRVYVEQQTLPDGSTVPVARPRPEQEAPQSLAYVQPLTITVEGSNGSNIIPYTGQTEEPITVTVTDPDNADAPVTGALVDLGWVSGTTDANGQVTLTFPLHGSTTGRVEVGDQFAWFAILDFTQDALLQVSMTDQRGTPIPSGNLDFHVVGDDRGVHIGMWQTGPSHGWAVMPAGSPARVVGVTTTGEGLYELYEDLTPQSYQAVGPEVVILDGASALALPVTVSLDTAGVNANVLLAPQDSYSYTVYNHSLFIGADTVGTLYVTPGTYEIGYHVPAMYVDEVETIVFDTVILGSATPALNAALSSSGLATLQTAFTDLPAVLDHGEFSLNHGKLPFRVPEGTVQMESGSYEITSVVLRAGMWWYNYAVVDPTRRDVTLAPGETRQMPFPVRPRAWSFDDLPTTGNYLSGWVNLRNSTNDVLHMAMQSDSPAQLGDVVIYNEADELVGTATLDLFGFDWPAPASPADQVYSYEGTYDLGPLGIAIDVAGIMKMGNPAYAVTKPTVIPAYLPTDLLVEVWNAPSGATVQIGESGPVQTLDENGEARFDALKVPGPQPIYVDGLRKGMVQAYGAVDAAQVMVEAPSSTPPFTRFPVVIKLINGQDIYGVQVDVNLDPNLVRVVGATETDPMAPNATWSAGPTISADGSQLQYLVSRLGETAGIGGEVPLLLMNLQLVGDVTAVDLATAVEVKLVDSMGNPIPVAVLSQPVVVGTPINGQVTSAGLTVAGAPVRLVDSTTKREVATTQTDSMGFFSLIISEDGTYDLVVNAWPYAPETATVTVTDGIPSIEFVDVALLYGDADGDGVVTEMDLSLLMERYADPALSGTPADLNNDGRFDLQDLYYAAQNAGSTTLSTQKEEGQ